MDVERTSPAEGAPGLGDRPHTPGHAAYGTAPRDRVVLLAGPSGSGKSRLAGRLHAARGWPIVTLDDFYRDLDDPDLPRSPTLGIVDWDDPRSWNAARAVTALQQLVETGHCEIPTYDISTSRATGSRPVTARPGDLIVAEGIFAAEICGELSSRGLLHAAYVVANNRSVTFVRRLLRDLSEHRKPPTVLLRRGALLWHDEPRIIARQTGLGAHRATPREAERALLIEPPRGVGPSR